MRCLSPGSVHAGRGLAPHATDYLPAADHHSDAACLLSHPRLDSTALRAAVERACDTRVAIGNRAIDTSRLSRRCLESQHRSVLSVKEESPHPSYRAAAASRREVLGRIPHARFRSQDDRQPAAACVAVA